MAGHLSSLATAITVASPRVWPVQSPPQQSPLLPVQDEQVLIRHGALAATPGRTLPGIPMMRWKASLGQCLPSNSSLQAYDSVARAGDPDLQGGDR